MIRYIATAAIVLGLFWLVDPSNMLGGVFMAALCCGGLWALEKVNRPLEDESAAARRRDAERVAAAAHDVRRERQVPTSAHSVGEGAT